MPSQPWAASSAQNGGMVSVGASNRARGTSGGQRASSQRRTVRRSSSWSSPMPMGMRLLYPVVACVAVGSVAKDGDRSRRFLRTSR